MKWGGVAESGTSRRNAVKGRRLENLVIAGRGEGEGAYQGHSSWGARGFVAVRLLGGKWWCCEYSAAMKAIHPQAPGLRYSVYSVNAWPPCARVVACSDPPLFTIPPTSSKLSLRLCLPSQSHAMCNMRALRECPLPDFLTSFLGVASGCSGPHSLLWLPPPPPQKASVPST